MGDPGRQEGGAWFHTVRTQGPVALGSDAEASGDLASSLADLVLFLDLPMPNGLLPETKF